MVDKKILRTPNTDNAKGKLLITVFDLIKSFAVNLTTPNFNDLTLYENQAYNT